jgi:hypothetical protein
MEGKSVGRHTVQWHFFRHYPSLVQARKLCVPADSVADPDPEISPPNPDPDPALVVFKKINVSVQYRAYVYLFTP